MSRRFADHYPVEEPQADRHLSLSSLVAAHGRRGRRPRVPEGVFADLNVTHQSHLGNSKEIQPPARGGTDLLPFCLFDYFVRKQEFVQDRHVDGDLLAVGKLAATELFLGERLVFDGHPNGIETAHEFVPRRAGVHDSRLCLTMLREHGRVPVGVHLRDRRKLRVDHRSRRSRVSLQHLCHQP